MIIAVDIGNTNIVVGGIEADHVLFTERLSTRTDKTELEYGIDNPTQLGSDLVVTAVAAIAAYPVPSIIIDMGTATTFSVINDKRQYIGGAIAPGAAVALNSLSSQTSQLPFIS